MIKNIGIICGNGQLPLEIGKNLISKNFNIVFFPIENFVDINKYKKFNYNNISLKSISKIFKTLDKNNITDIIFAGQVLRPSIKDISFDISTLKLIKIFFMESSGDDKLLKAIVKLFESEGFKLFDWKDICIDIFSTENHLTLLKPSKKALLNCKKGLNLFKKIGTADIGQSIILQNEIILGIEASEGTDELISRCNNYKKKGDGGVLIKLSKYNQNNLLDIPTIGIQTVKNICKYNYEGIFLEKNNCIVLNKNEVIDYSNKHNIFISTINKIEQ